MLHCESRPRILLGFQLIERLFRQSQEFFGHPSLLCRFLSRSDGPISLELVRERSIALLTIACDCRLTPGFSRYEYANRPSC